MNYKINHRSILKNLSFSFFLVFIGVLYYILSINISNFIDIKIVWIVISILLLIVLLLFLDYLVHSTKGNIVVDCQNITIQNDKEDQIINIENIEKVLINASPSWNRNSTVRFFPFEAFHFVEIKLKKGDSIYITSLSDYNLYKTIQQEKLFEELIYLNKKGLTGNGSLINSIFWDRLD